jgi:hypothetical protein
MTATAPFTVDTISPTLLAKSTTGNNESMLTTIKVTFSETMNKMSSLVTIPGINGKMAWDGNNVTFTPSEALNGRTLYSVTAYGRDLAGNPVSSSWTFRTAAVGKVSGILHGHDGKILANTVVNLIGQNTSASTGMNSLTLSVSGVLGTARTTTTDANGFYAFYDVPIGNYSLEITEKGYQTMSKAVAMTADAVATGGLVVDPGASPSNPNGPLFILAFGALAGVIGLMVILVRRRGPPSAVEPQTEVARIDDHELAEEWKRKRWKM